MKSSRIVLGVLGLMALAPALHADTVAFTNARLPSVLADTDARGVIVINSGRILAIGENVKVPADARVIDVQGDVITPGFVVSNTSLGALEITAGADANDSGSRSTHVSAAVDVQYALNPASTLVPIARRGGVTRAIVTPRVEPVDGRESFYGGQAAVIHTADGDSILARERVAMMANLGVNEVGRAAAFAQLRAELADVRTYAGKRAALERNQLRARDWNAADLDALVLLVSGDVPLVVAANRASDILNWLTLAEDEEIEVVLVGVAEGWRVADAIAEAGVSVILNPSDNLPSNFDRLGATLKNVSLLHDAGVTFAITTGRAGHDARHLRYFAGLAVAHGLPYAAALDAITVNAARVWGQDDFGALAVGQAADLAVWSGDPFEPLTSLKAVYIGGKSQSLETRQTLLAEKYRARGDTTAR